MFKEAVTEQRLQIGRSFASCSSHLSQRLLPDMPQWSTQPIEPPRSQEQSTSPKDIPRVITVRDIKNKAIKYVRVTTAEALLTQPTRM